MKKENQIKEIHQQKKKYKIKKINANFHKLKSKKMHERLKLCKYMDYSTNKF